MLPVVTTTKRFGSLAPSATSRPTTCIASRDAEILASRDATPEAAQANRLPNLIFEIGSCAINLRSGRPRLKRHGAAR